jgi:PAS domain-containing protein
MKQGKNQAIAGAQLRALLVGNNEPGVLKFRNFLEDACLGQVSLEHARSESEAVGYLQTFSFDIVFCDYLFGDGSALRLLQELHNARLDLPVIFLSDHLAEEDIERALAAMAARNGVKAGSLIVRSLCNAIRSYCKISQQQKAGDTLRKLWRAVEQTADLIVVTDRLGAIEYVNPAFEAITGYTREESIGQNIRFLKSNQQASDVYEEMWRIILGGETFRGVIANQKRMGTGS